MVPGLSASSGPCSIPKAFNVTVPGITTQGGFGNMFRVTADGVCLLITSYENGNDLGFVGIDVTSGKTAWSWQYPCYYSQGLCLVSPDQARFVDDEDAFITMLAADVGGFSACSSMVKVSFNGTSAWTAWEDSLCSPIYGQVFAGGIVNLLRLPSDEQVAMHLDTSNSGSYPPPAHLAAVYRLNGTLMWKGNLTVSPFDMYRGLHPVYDTHLAVVSQLVLANSSQRSSFLFSFASDGTPTLLRREDPLLWQNSLFGGQFSNYVQASGDYGVQAFSVATGAKTWNSSDARLLRNKVSWPAEISFGFAQQQWSRVASSDAVFLLDFTKNDGPDAAAYVVSSYDMSSGALLWQNAMQVSNTSCYVGYGVLPVDSSPVMVMGQQWQAYNPKTGAVIGQGALPSAAACFNVMQQWAVVDLDGSSLFLNQNAKSTILGFPGK